MADILSRLQPPEGAVKARRRVGRGVGSGMGKTSTRGQKGQKARSKGNINKTHFQGGQTPMQRRLPKRGFRNPLAARVANVNVGALEIFDAGATVDIEALKAKRLIQGRYDLVKVLGDGELTKKLTVHAHKFSAGAVSKIEATGGKTVAVARVAAAPADDTASKN
jgi:large subunit ribosomal protein L15